MKILTKKKQYSHVSEGRGAKNFVPFQKESFTIPSKAILLEI